MNVAGDLCKFRISLLSIVASLKVLLVPIILYVNWQLVSPILVQFIPQGNTYLSSDLPNPFAQFFLLSHPVPSLDEENLRYQKGWSDLLFIAYYGVFWSLIRQSLSIYLLKPMARYYGIKREQKLDRFAEQGYAVVYFAVMGAWGYVCCLCLSIHTVYSLFRSALWANFLLGGIVPKHFG